MFGQLDIDTAKFAREGTSLSGALSLADMPRVAKYLSDSSGQLSDLGGDIRYVVRGYMTDRGDPALAIRITGGVNLRCERCLERLQYDLLLERDLVLLTGIGEFEPQDDEDDLVDIIPATPHLDLHATLEEEVVLGLPMAPRHAEGECHAPGEAGGGERQPSAFAVLAKLKQ
jgi:uncharacterized protein